MQQEINNSVKTKTSLNKLNGDEMALSEHIEEFSQRLIFCLVLFLISTFACFADIRQIVKIFQAPAIGVKFLQFAPGEYFFASIKIAVFSGFLLSSPLILYQIFLYVVPGMTKNERQVLLPMTLGSGVLFAIGLAFAYFFLVPAALRFFITYGSEVVEPFWSFDEYFNFTSILIFVTGLSFQVPIVQIVLGLLGIVSGQTMLGAWKYVVVIATVLAALITPSTDPITQLLMAGALLLLYLSGSGIVILLKK